jgi:hypothetical protein
MAWAVWLKVFNWLGMTPVLPNSMSSIF